MENIITIDAYKAASFMAEKWFRDEYENHYTFRALHEQPDDSGVWKLKPRFRDIIDEKIAEIELNLSNFIV